MDVQTAIKKRRATKQFDQNHKMSEQEINELMSLTLLSPTAFNIQHWRFVLSPTKSSVKKFVRHHGCNRK